MARGTVPAVAVVLLVGCTVVAAAAVAVAAGGFAAALDRPPSVAVSVTATGETGRVAVTHEGGPALSLSSVRLRIAVDGRPLAHQPPVPFFAARGFRAGPTGPFNVASDGVWTAGETGSVRVAGTNAPAVESGVRVTVTVYVDGTRAARARTNAG